VRVRRRGRVLARYQSHARTKAGTTAPPATSHAIGFRLDFLPRHHSTPAIVATATMNTPACGLMVKAAPNKRPLSNHRLV
jgi:hypothetical protein